VSRGKEGEFLQAWTAFLEWSTASHPGLRRAILLQDVDDAAHYISVAFWSDAQSRQAWQSNPGFPERMRACRTLCDDFSGGSFRLAAAVDS
jgi:heme-degrading monooxygenase HmoA